MASDPEKDTANRSGEEHSADCDVTVQLSDCGRAEAEAVFGALSDVFAGCEDVAPRPASGREPTVWTATFDSSARSGEPAGAPRLDSPVEALLTGGQHALEEVEKALGRIFEVRSAQHVPGEHEAECRLLLASR
ncbi:MULTISPECIES: hypothetical protein [Streptomyces]|uniref:Uncharacterized protein n=1 Tax=Streptomyces sudanensis TaxID=436397 RepID=A0ABY4T6V5_9ACTN|nr:MULTISPECIES: hypothetical protein [Streptomyces]MCP9956282.1 hypothetical protein [Streptomyces sudanensis]MCP9985494.1 hypothetical protein [Streptomyces sudanensis]MCQ0003091.1 hypothetical protein [Streptomyces sudanensis]URN14709.1 hypothetical protein MW084_00885 [Streptomyces sudanensis]